MGITYMLQLNASNSHMKECEIIAANKDSQCFSLQQLSSEKIKVHPKP